jgi:hypothetical protein
MSTCRTTPQGLGLYTSSCPSPGRVEAEQRSVGEGQTRSKRRPPRRDSSLPCGHFGEFRSGALASAGRFASGRSLRKWSATPVAARGTPGAQYTKRERSGARQGHREGQTFPNLQLPQGLAAKFDQSRVWRGVPPARECRLPWLGRDHPTVRREGPAACDDQVDCRRRAGQYTVRRKNTKPTAPFNP